MKFRAATMEDKLKDVFLVYGMEIDKKLLLPKEFEDFVFYLNDKPQKNTIELLKKEFAKSRKVPNKKDFAKICGTAATKFSGLSLKMEVFVKSDVANGEN